MTWIYQQTEPHVFTVFVQGESNSDSDWGTREEAAARCHYLNGGEPVTVIDGIDTVTDARTVDAALASSFERIATALESILELLENRLEGPVERRRRYVGGGPR